MTSNYRAALFALILLIAPLLHAQASESSISGEIQKLRSYSADQRPAATTKVALEIRTLPTGSKKVDLATSLAGLATEGDQGKQTLQAVADTLARALAESPVTPKNDEIPSPYRELASLVRYEGVTTTLADALFVKAGKQLAANDAAVEKVDFTLKDLNNKKVTLSELRGKIVMVNFWATWCPPCRLEMPDLDFLYTSFQPQGLVVLSITDEDPAKVNSFIAASGYHPPVLLDPGDAIRKLFRFEGIPRTFLFDRGGKLIGVAEDQRTRGQFLAMLARAGLHLQ
jgi:thiol-disulfide isomerase/thioredoxin